MNIYPNRYKILQTAVFFILLFIISGLTFADSSEHYYTPERIILNLTEHPSTSQAVTWRTQAEAPEAQAQIALETDSVELAEGALTVKAATEPVKLDHGKIVYHHSLVFKSLMPDTLYVYRVGDGKKWSEWFQFRTADDADDSFTFVYFGDIQTDIKSLCPRVFRAAYGKAPDAAFWLFVGDMVNNGDNDGDWGELFYAFSWMSGMTPAVMLPGNHEYPDMRFIFGKAMKLHALWRPQFTLPENGPKGLEETAYFVDYQGVRIVMLNGNEKLNEQAEWLDKILSENPQHWTIAAIHQPFYSTGRRRDNSKRQRLFLPVFDKYGVDLVLQGHDHNYARTCKLRNGEKVSDNETGTTYITSVSGTKVYDITKRHDDIMVKSETGKQLFQVITVDKHRLRYESFNIMGELYDFFELTK